MTNDWRSVVALTERQEVQRNKGRVLDRLMGDLSQMETDDPLMHKALAELEQEFAGRIARIHGYLPWPEQAEEKDIPKPREDGPRG